MHEEDEGFTLTFIFEENTYFKGTEYKKSFIMSKPNVIEKCVGQQIEWTPGSDPTHEKKKKKVKKGGKKTTVTVNQKCDSFFNFFDTVEMTEEDATKGKDDDDDEEENDVAAKMDEDFDIGNTFKDDIVPLCLEYYLGVIEQVSDDEAEEDDDDSDEDAPPKKAKGKKGPAGGLPPGKNPEECK